MRGMRARILKKFKYFPHVTYLKQEVRTLVVPAYPSQPTNPSPRKILGDLLVCADENCLTQHPEVIDVEELMKDLEDFGEEFDQFREKENISPRATSDSNANTTLWSSKKNTLDDIVEAQGQMVTCKVDDVDFDVQTYRPTDFKSLKAFDPQLLAAFREAVMEHIISIGETKNKDKAEHDHKDEEKPRVEEDSQIIDPLLEFEELCPPGGSNAVILYTTSLRGIRKTFEDCNRVKFLLESTKIMFSERDISMHLEFREELWKTLENRVIPPRLFVKGRYIGGADEVLGLHEQGRLVPLLRGLPEDKTATALCKGCGGKKFIMCGKCSGSCKIFDEENLILVQCQHCNENGLIFCPMCSKG